YQLFAFFNNSPTEVRRTDTNDLFEDSAKVTIPLPDEERLRKRVDELEGALSGESSDLIAAQLAWEQDAASPVAWSVLRTASNESSGGAKLELQEDGSLLADGPSPDRDSYSLVLESVLPQITAIRLEVLPTGDSQHPGPGRTSHGNFVLSEFRAQIVAARES